MGFHVRWCNGSTEVFGAFSRGSNPRRTASQHYAPPMLPDGPEMRANHPMPRWRETNSGRGPPHSKTLRVHQGRGGVRQLLDCASPLALLERRVTDDRRASFAGRAGGARRTAAEDCRTPRRFAFTKTGGKCASFWTCASPLALLEKRVTDDGRASFAGRPRGARRTAGEDCRTPRRFAFTKAEVGCASFWTAPVLWRFWKGEWQTTAGQALLGVPVARDEQRQRTAALQDASRSPRPEGSAPAFGPAPVLWRCWRSE